MEKASEKISRSSWFILVTLSCLGLIAMYALGMTLFLNLVGQSIGPSISGMFQQMNRGTIEGNYNSYPTPEAYTMIFLTAFLVSLASVVFAFWLNRDKELKLENKESH